MLPHRKRLCAEITQSQLGILLIAPAIVFIVAVNIYPVLYSLYNSTFHIRGIQNLGFVGLQNYIDLLQSPRLWRSLAATFYFATGTIMVQLILGMAISLALNVEFWGQKLVRALIVVPWAIPTSLAALMWRRFFHPVDGYVNATLRMLGLLEGDLSWFIERFLAIAAVVFVDSWKTTSLFVLIFLAALQAIPRDLYESASIEGANRFQTFFYITLPIMKPILLVALIMRTIFVFQAFDIIHLMTAGGPGDSTRVLSYYAYQETFTFMQYGRGAALSFILFAITGLVTLGYIYLLRKNSDVSEGG